MEADDLKMDLYHGIALNRIEGIGPARVSRLLEIFHSPRNIFDSADESLLRRLGLDDHAVHCIVHFSSLHRLHAEIEGDLRWQELPDQHILHMSDPGYPELLGEIHQPPPVLYLKGNPERLHEPQLAMVGSRRSSIGGRETARMFARDLSDVGITVTSGLALGIDGESHRGALLGTSGTIAVLATGVDLIYPRRHLSLAQSIIDQDGLLVSESPLGTRADAFRFPRRNRIISGLSLGTLIVEASLRSGSLITARLAMEQGREVFAIPGSVHSPVSRGCHKLIQDGAKLVQNLQDILDELPLINQADVATLAAGGTGQLSRVETMLLEALGADPVPVDKLVEYIDLPVQDILSGLAVLELQNRVTRESRGYRLSLT